MKPALHVWASLSEREREAVELIAAGLSRKAAAARMNVRVPTFDTYVDRVCAKLGHLNRDMRLIMLWYWQANEISKN